MHSSLIFQISIYRSVISMRCRDRPPRSVAVPGALLAVKAAASLTDRCHSLRSLYPSPTALPSLPVQKDFGARCAKIFLLFA